ncbi:hypothetical protein ACQ4PT_062491 [Festuca glaucescens]
MSRIASSRLALRLLPRTSAASFSSVSPAAAAAAAAAAASFPSKEAAAAALPPKEAAAAASASSSAAGDPSSAPPQGPASRSACSRPVSSPPSPLRSAPQDTSPTMTREFRKNSRNPIPEDLSGFEKYKATAYFEAMKVPVAAIDLYLDVRSQIEDQIKGFVEPSSEKLLPDLPPNEQHVFTVVLDLNDTLVHSDWKDLSKLNRNPAQVIYISGHALESCLQPENCLPIKPWKLETDDTQLIDLIPFLDYLAMSRVTDIRPVLASFQGRDIPTEFLERSR